MKRGQEMQALANCHARGLYSIPLNVKETSAERMFIDSLGQVHTVAPHNHRYSLTLTILRGHIAHTIWTPSDFGAIAMYRYEWASPIEGETEGRFTLKSPEPTRFDLSTDLMGPSEYVVLAAEQFHSLVAKPGTVWMVREGLDTYRSETLAFTPNYQPDLTGLYVPLPPPSAVAA